jgi:GNAT superfamily N-acetyltransferase
MVRPVESSDNEAIAALVTELGYPAASGEIVARLGAMEVSGRSVALVAELDARVVGLITAHMLSTIHHSSPVAWLTALVVSARARGSGVGRELVRGAEEWARAQGAVRMSVTSGAQREDAHAFYIRIGYGETGVRFGKSL